MNDEVQRAWAEQTTEEPRLDPARLRAASITFERQVRRRNALEYGAAAVVVVAFAGVAVVASDPLRRAAAALIVLGAISVVVTLARRGTAAPLPGSLGAPTLAWRSAELTRQRDLLAGVWRWYLGPLVPGMALLVASSALRATDPARLALALTTGVVGAAVFVAIGAMNRAAAAQLDRELADLEGVASGPDLEVSDG